jgi:hypothetical protein
VRRVLGEDLLELRSSAGGVVALRERVEPCAHERLLGRDGRLAQLRARRRSRLLVARALGEREHLLPERPRLLGAPGGVERGRELEGGTVVGRVRGEHLLEFGYGRLRVMTRIECVEASLHRRRLILDGRFGRAAAERDREGDG